MKRVKLFLTLSILTALLWGAETEVVAKRTFTSNTYISDNGQYRMVVHPYPVNYLNGEQYLPIPEGEEEKYYTELAHSQMASFKSGNIGLALAKSTVGSLGAWGVICQKIDSVTSYVNDQDGPFGLGLNYIDSDNWSKDRIIDEWMLRNLDPDYIIDSTIYEITLTSTYLTSGNMTIQWMYLGSHYSWNSPEEEYNAIGNGSQYGTITLTGNSSSTQIKRIKWNTGSTFCDTLQHYWLDQGSEGIDLISGLKTNIETSGQYNLAIVSAQSMTVYYTPPKKSILVDNCILNTSTSIGGQLRINGTLPAGTNETNNAGSTPILYLDSAYVISEPEDIIAYSSTNYVHHYWKENSNDYELNHDLIVYDYITDDIGNFNNQQSVTVTKQNGGSEAIAIKDPWWKDPFTNQRHNPPVYQDLSGTSYSVFVDQNAEFNSSTPIYTLKAPNIGQVTSNDFYVFDHWQSPSASVAVFDAQGATSTTNRETPVVFKSANATVTAHYVSANQSGRTVTVASGESLSLPAGGTYAVANSSFKLDVSGTLNLPGTSENPIAFTFADTTTCWGGIVVQSGGTLNCEYTNITGAGTGVEVFHGGNANIKHSTFIDCYPAILSNNGIVAIENCVFKQVHDMVYPGYVYLNIAPNVEEDYKIYNNTFVNADEHSGVLIHFTDQSIQTVKDVPADGIDPVEEVPSGSRVFIFNNIFTGLGTGVNITGSDSYDHDVYVHNDCFYDNEMDIDFEVEYISVLDTLRRNPRFVNPALDNYHLQSTSPCINAGKSLVTAYYTPYDPDNTIKDIGAYYFDFVPAAPYLISATWVSSHPKLLWNRVADLDISTYRVYKTYVNSSGTRTTTVDVGSDTTYTDPDITYVAPRFANTTATYKITAIDSILQESSYSNSKSVSGNGALWKPVADVPTEFALRPAYPNPFNPVTQIRFDVPSTSIVQIDIYDGAGKGCQNPGVW